MKQILTLAACIVAVTCVAQSKKFDFKPGPEYGLPIKTEDFSISGQKSNPNLTPSFKVSFLYVNIVFV